MCGGVAFTSHSSKAATRLLVNHSPEPFSNIALSLAEDLFVPFGAWLAIRHPLVTLTLVLIFLVVFSWISTRVFRLIRLEMIALWTWISSSTRAAAVNHRVVADALALLSHNARPLPPGYQRAIGAAVPGVRCAATKKIRGLRNSIGYLCITGDDIVFVTRRSFRYRQHRLPISGIRVMEFKPGLLLSRLVVSAGTDESTFYLFRDFETASVSTFASASSGIR